jgi:hypothetical protein
VPGFGNGAVELARLIVYEFQRSFSKVNGDLRAMAAKFEGFDQAVKPVEVDHGSRPEDSLFHSESYKLEDAVGSLQHCLDSQGVILSARSGKQVAHTSSFFISDELESAFNAVWAARGKVSQAFQAVAAAN